MKSYLALVLAISFAVVLSAGDDQKCKADFQSFLACVKDQYEKIPESEKQAAKKDRQDKADKCFQQASCDSPDWNSDPAGGMGKGGHMGMDMPKAVKECLKKKLIEKVGAKLNDCLSKKGVRNVNFTALADSFSGAGFGMEGHGGDGAKEGLQSSMKAQFTAVKAVDKCAQKKGGDTNSVKPLEQCLYNIKKEQRPKICALTKPCEDKVTGECKKRGQELKKALCQCKQEKESEIAKKLRVLGQSQKKVGIQDLMKTVADDLDMQDMMKQVDICYDESNEPEPPILKLAMKLLSGGGRGGGPFNAAMSVSGSQVVIMADMMTLDAEDDSQCQPCA